jgi:hypothetical protein
MNHRIKINKVTGQIQWLTPPPFLSQTREVSRHRFSEIIPRNLVLRAAFRILRFLFGEVGKVSDWTRSWPCMWKMIILQGTYKNKTSECSERQALLDLEQSIFFDGIDKIV